MQKAVNNVMPMEFATLLQEGGLHESAPQRQAVRTAISPLVCTEPQSLTSLNTTQAVCLNQYQPKDSVNI
jgi:hypothetical protein